MGEDIQQQQQSLHSEHLLTVTLRNKIDDVRADLVLPYGDCIVLSESWLGQEESKDDPSLQLGDYKLHLNNYGSGKGLAVYYKEEKFTPSQDYKTEHLQISILQSQDLCVVGLYRSDANKTLAATLKEVIPADGSCLVTGDFNICSARYPDHDVFLTLRSMGFKLLNSEATHFRGGHLDQAWLRSREENTIQLYSPYYTCTDHDALLFTMHDSRTEQGDYYPLGGSICPNAICSL